MGLECMAVRVAVVGVVEFTATFEDPVSRLKGQKDQPAEERCPKSNMDVGRLRSKHNAERSIGAATLHG